MFTDSEGPETESSEEDPTDPFSVKRKTLRRIEKARIAAEKEKEMLEEEARLKEEEEERIKTIRAQRVAQGLPGDNDISL